MPSRWWKTFRACVFSCLAFGVTNSGFPGSGHDAGFSPMGEAMAQVRKQRPRIGLALSGGGARGLAHVGVLAELERLRIPVDYIAGTSMGAVVGGLYAVGLSPAEIEETMLHMDWSNVFNDRPPRRVLTFRRKEDDRSYLLDVELGLDRHGVRLPKSFIAGQKLSFAFDVPALHTAGIQGFDRLPVPFRATATNLRTGELQILSSGSLIRALRASMSVPGAFSPVEINREPLVDGGFSRHLPADVARNMGADVVIAVDVIGELLGDEAREFSSFQEITMQVINLAARVNTSIVLEDIDLLIEPDMPAVSFFSFYRQNQAIQAGRTSVERMTEALEPYSITEPEYETYQREKRWRSVYEAQVDSVHIVNRSRLSQAALDNVIRVQAGDSLELDELRRSLSQLYGLGTIELADFSLELGSRNERILHIVIHEKAYGPTFLHLGGDFTSDVQGQTDVRGLARVTRTNINGFGGEWRSQLEVGTELGGWSEWYQPLHSSRRAFASTSVSYFKTFQGFYGDSKRLADLRLLDFQVNVDLGVNLGRLAELRAGAYWGNVDLEVNVAGLELTHDNINEGGMRFRFQLDDIDDPDFPKNGNAAHVVFTRSIEAMGGETSYSQLRTDYRAYKTLGANTLGLMLAGGHNFGTSIPIHRQFRLGGFGSFSGFETDELRGPLFCSLRLVYFRELSSSFDLLGTRFYGGAWFTGGDAWQTRRAVRLDALEWAWTVGLGLDSVLGPLFAAYGHNFRSGDSIFLTLGRQLGVSTTN